MTWTVRREQRRRPLRCAGLLVAGMAIACGDLLALAEPKQLAPIIYDENAPDGFVANPDMGAPTISYPPAGEIWYAGEDRWLTCEVPVDVDTCETDSGITVNDHVTVWWSCDVGNFKIPAFYESFFPFGYIGDRVCWTAPLEPTEVTFTCHANDDYLDWIIQWAQWGPGPNDQGLVTRTYADYCVGNDAEKTASVSVYIVKLQITAVPYEYYADSASWVPFRFALLGAPANILVTGGTAEFYLGDEKKFESGLLVKPFKPENGYAKEYVAVINESLFDAISTSGSVAENARLKLRSVTSVNMSDAKVLGPYTSDFSTTFKFGDASIEIVEFGKDENFHYRRAETRQDQVDSNPTLQARAMKATWGDPCPRTIQFQEIGLHGFDDYYCGAVPASGDYTQRCMIYDDWDLTGVGGGNTVEVRCFGKQSGVYMVAFRNQVPAGAPGNPFGVPVVGVVNSLPGSVVLFQGGTVTGTVYESDWYGSSTLTRTFNFLHTALTGVAFVCPPAGAALGRATKIISDLQTLSDMVTVIEDLDYCDMSEIVAYGVIDLANGTTRPSQSNAFTILRAYTEQTTPAIPLNIGNPSLGMVVGNTYRLYLDTDVNVRAMSRYTGSIYVDSKLEVDLGDEKFDVAWPTPSPELVNKIMCDFE